MKKSVRFRITIIFIAIMAVLIAAIYLMNRFFLQSYYGNEKVRELETAYEALNEMNQTLQKEGISIYDFDGPLEADGSEEDSAEDEVFRRFTGRSNIDIVILDTENGRSFEASREGNWLLLKLKTYLEFSDAIENGQIPDSKFTLIRSTDRYSVQMNFDRRSGTTNMECWGTFTDEKTAFLMVMPLESITESIRISNRFVLIVGLAVLVIGSIIIWFTTAAVTKPLDRLAGISKKMANLDFTEKYTGQSQDEIGTLGLAMNTMSERLEKTISDLQAANAKLQEDIDLKVKVDTARKEFVSNVSHELKTPIALIEGYAEGLTEGIAEDPEMRDYYCSVIMDEARKMNTMVKQLTSLTQYEFGAANLTMENFNLTELIRNVLEREKLRLEEKEIIVSQQLPEACMVLADEFKTEEVFTNYLTNAMNHIGGKRRIIVKVERLDVKTIRLSVYNDGENIPEESLEHLWEKFYKVDKARTREYGGSGIGLSIVKAIAEAHGQRYGVINRPEGVEFYVTLDSIE